MFGRMSWEAPAFQGHNPLEHIHGPDCECNPESALRVQFLRLVHNFVDRDFHNNPIAELLLSPPELEEVLQRGGGGEGGRGGELPATGTVAATEKEEKEGGGGGGADSLADPSTGLLTRITRVLIKEPFDSVYRFWLSSCLESFLRGTGPAEQLFLAAAPLPRPSSSSSSLGKEWGGSALLDHLVRHITGHPPAPSSPAPPSSTAPSSSSVSNLQTSFDLLGELVRYNPAVVELLEARLLQLQSMDKFLAVVLGNLVDSNVFLRSLVLTVEKLGRRGEGAAGGQGAEVCVFHLPPCCLAPCGVAGECHCCRHLNLWCFEIHACMICVVLCCVVMCCVVMCCLHYVVLCCVVMCCVVCVVMCYAAGRGGFALVAAGLFPAGEREEDHLLAQSSSPSLPSPSSSAALSFLSATPSAAVASASYLTHSWLHFTPPVLSPEAARVGAKQQHGINKASASTNKGNKTKPRPSGAKKSSTASSTPAAQQHDSSDTSFASLTSGMRDAFKSIREVTNSLIGSRKLLPSGGEAAASNSAQSDPQVAARSVSSNVSLYDFKDAIEEFENELKNESSRNVSGPESSGDLGTSTGGRADECCSGSSIDDCAEKDIVQDIAATDKAMRHDQRGAAALVQGGGEKAGAAGAGGSMSTSTSGSVSRQQAAQALYDAPLVLSPGSRHLSAFLQAHRPEVMLRLMCVVTLRSVNHENICCINTTLLLFIFANRM
jgi:hypothetical protein